MKNIGVDLDGVLADHVTHLINHMKIDKLIPHHYNREMVSSWDTIIFGYNFKDIFESYLKSDRFTLSMPSIDFSAEALKILSEDHYINIITARPSYAVYKTYKWLEDNGYIYTSLSIGYAEDRISLGIDILIDDNPFAIREFSKRGIAIIYDQPWNRGYEYSDNVIRVYSWEEIIEILSRL
jgi:5'(3')-deoxyribonucleotidase